MRLISRVRKNPLGSLSYNGVKFEWLIVRHWTKISFIKIRFQDPSLLHNSIIDKYQYYRNVRPPIFYWVLGFGSGTDEGPLFWEGGT